MAQYKGWEVVAEYSDVISGMKDARPGLDQALSLLRDKQADMLVVARIDRLGRSVSFILSLFKKAEEQGWSIAIREIDLDTSTPSGRMCLTMLAAMAAFERDLISARTKEALAARKARGIRLGAPPMSKELEDQALALRRHGLSYEQCAAVLNARGVAAPRGGQWTKSSLARLYKREGLGPDPVIVERSARIARYLAEHS